MKRILVVLAAGCLLSAAPAGKPKLVVAVVIDQFRYDYLTRFRAEYTAGFARLLERGAVFTDAHYIHFPTVTAVGHSTFLSGATPSVSGIVGNEWFDRDSATRVTSVSDPTVALLGVPPGRTGSSPRRLLVSTVGDELKMSGKGSKVIGISFKDRSAILASGHMADGAYWFDGATGNWVSSAYYFADLPGWVKDVNKSRPADKFAGVEWRALDAKPDAKPFAKLGAASGTRYYGSLDATPFSNELIEAMAERCVSAEQLGHHAGADLLAVSFSGNDYIGHAFGPDSPQVRDISIRTDRLFGKMLAFLDSQVGAGNYLLVLTADHGVAPTPEANAARKMPGGRLSMKTVLQAIQTSLAGKYGDGNWVLGTTGDEFYLDHKLIDSKKVDEAAVERTAAEALRAIPHIARVYTGEEIALGQVQHDAVSQAISNGYYKQRSGELLVVLENYWMFGESGASGTTHGTPFNYDNHVPVIFLGAGIRPGEYHGKIAVNDVAPTLASILEVEEPSGSMGRVLEELWSNRAAR